MTKKEIDTFPIISSKGWITLPEDTKIVRQVKSELLLTWDRGNNLHAKMWVNKECLGVVKCKQGYSAVVKSWVPVKYGLHHTLQSAKIY